jgi:hypothetical protein|uniref:hypothetical protein n=1 Tax=Cephaloticoccus sp. TaxID=1985742 RepID=UPI004048F681
MKTLATVSLLAASALILAPKPAAAGDREIAAIGGFIGGLIVGSNLNHNQPYCPPVVSDPTRGPVVVYGSGGYWQTSCVQVWISPTWTVVYDNYRRPVRRFVPGHYESRNNRVWVASNRNFHNNDRHDRHDDHNRHSSRNDDRRDRRRDDRRDRH